MTTNETTPLGWMMEGVTSERFWREGEKRIESGSAVWQDTKEKGVRRWRLEEKGITVAFPRHGEEGCMILMFMLRCIYSHDGARHWPLTVRLGRVRPRLEASCCAVGEEGGAILERAVASVIS